MKLILLANFFSTVFMTGVVWIIQLVQYPSFAQISEEKFQVFHSHHSFWITPAVAPMMIVELLTSIILVIYPDLDLDYKLLWGGLILAITVWLSTFFLQVPLHEKLAQGFDAKALEFLVNSNWVRVFAWTLHSVLVSFFIWKNFK